MIEKIALATALIGLFSLIVLSQFIEPKVVEISSINENMIERQVMIHGNITSIKNFNNMELLTVQSLYDNSKITVVVFENIDIERGIAQIKGKVKEYYGSIEIEADEIKRD